MFDKSWEILDRPTTEDRAHIKDLGEALKPSKTVAAISTLTVEQHQSVKVANKNRQQ